MNNELIEQLADKLGVGVEHVWGVLIHQASIEVFMDIFTMIVFVTLLSIGYYLIKNMMLMNFFMQCIFLYL